MAESLEIITDAFVKVNISNSRDNHLVLEKRLDKSIILSVLKTKLEVITGGNADTMQLELYDGDKFICKLEDNGKPLGYYPVEDGMRIHVIDNFQYEAENVEKFELTEEQYNMKEDSLKSFLMRNKLGKYNEEEMKKLEEKKKKALEEEKEKAESLTVGSRCQVTMKGQPRRIGTIMYNGPLDGKPSACPFIGVKFDLPLGRNDGTFEGKRYFECPPKYGAFVVPSGVTVGDFPPDDDIDEI